MISGFTSQNNVENVFMPIYTENFKKTLYWRSVLNGTLIRMVFISWPNMDMPVLLNCRANKSTRPPTGWHNNRDCLPAPTPHSYNESPSGLGILKNTVAWNRKSVSYIYKDVRHLHHLIFQYLYTIYPWNVPILNGFTRKKKRIARV